MQRLNGFIRRYVFEPELENPVPEEWNRTQDEILNKIGGFHCYSQPEVEELREVYRVLIKAWHEGHDISYVDKKVLLRSPWVLFYRTDETSTLLVNDQDFLTHYLEIATQIQSGGFYSLLYYCFLLNYPYYISNFEVLSSGIAHGLNKATSGRERLYRKREVKLRFLDRSTGARLAEEYVLGSLGAEQFLSKSRLVGALRCQGFVEYLFICILDFYRSKVQTPGLKMEDKRRLIKRLNEMAFVDNVKLRFPAHRASFITSLLEPFANNPLEKELKEKIRDFLIGHFGDPRTDQGRWQGVSETARTVILSWLASETMDDFFNLFDHVLAKDAQFKRQWKYRRAFWTAYLENGYIQDAWVALGLDAVREARRFIDRPGISYGRLDEWGASSMHSALIMSIGGLTIVEWSHSGQCHAWPQGGDKTPPELYQKHYEPRNLRLGGRNEKPPFVHYASEHYTWQREVADYIRRTAGINMPGNKYVVRS